MRNLNANALAKIATTHGNEPITILEVDWIEDGGSKLYADRTAGGIQGKILEVGDLDNVIGVSNNDSSQELSITLDDTDDTLKTILNTNDIHKRSARVYQWFDGMGIDDRFLLFAGKISSPITWNERDRTVSFTVISQLEDKEVGFSAEEGQFPWIPKDLIDKAWPMIFGKVQDVPAMQFNQAVKGTTLCGVGITSGKDYNSRFSIGGNTSQIGLQLAQMQVQIHHLSNVYETYEHSRPPVKDGNEKAIAPREQMEALITQYNQLALDNYRAGQCAEYNKQKSIEDNGGDGCNPVSILGGEDFPQNIGMSIQIGQGIFTGYFEGDKFHISDRLHEENEEKSRKTWEKYQLGGDDTPDFCKSKEELNTFRYWHHYKTMVGTQELVSWGFIDVEPVEATSRPKQISFHYWAEAGTTVEVSSTEEITYVASIIPGTVLAVKAYKNFESERKLINVPTDLYTVESHDYGPITAVQLVFDKPLSTITEQGWEDNIYVTFESEVGPHTCDILQYIIDNFTDLEWDSTSFTDIRTSLDPFPMNFPILEKKNALTVLQEIAFQARCALWISNGTFYIKYLPEEPDSDDTITESDIDAESGIEIELTDTEDLVTRMDVEWRISWNEDDPNKVILRHNVKKYGTQKEDYFFYCFNQPDIVLKAATFWLVRNSNTWKRIRFSTYLQKLNLETFDTVTLDFTQDYVSTGSVKAIVEEATYDSNSRSVKFVCLTPVRSGEMVEYKFFWPSSLTIDDTYPPQDEIDAGFAGGDGIGTQATGLLPIGFVDPDDWEGGVVFVGGPNVIFTGPADHGESIITDIGFVAQPVIFTVQYGELDVSANPDPNLLQVYREDQAIAGLVPIEHDTVGIDIRKTPFYDSNKGPGGPSATLDTFFKTISENPGGENGRLIVDCDESVWTNDESGEKDGKEFHFKYDEDNKKFGAGTAWLQDD